MGRLMRGLATEARVPAVQVLCFRTGAFSWPRNPLEPIMAHFMEGRTCVQTLLRHPKELDSKTTKDLLP